MAVTDRDLDVTTSDGAMRAYEAVPERNAGTAVVVIQEAFGVNGHIESIARRFADAGHHAVAPDLFHRAGGGTAPYGDFSKVLPLFEGLTDDGILVDVDAAVDHLHTAGFDDSRIGIVGFCFGGRVTFLVALRRRLGAAVGLYGGGIVSASRLGFPALVDDVAELRSPWLGLFGDLDEGIPVGDVERLRAALADAPVPTEVVRYADAGHGFNCDERASYHRPSAEDGWQRTLAWFTEHLAR